MKNRPRAHKLKTSARSLGGWVAVIVMNILKSKLEGLS